MMRTPLSAVFSGLLSARGEGKLGLPSAGDDEPLTARSATSPKSPAAARAESCTLKIGGMTCGACVEVRTARARRARR
jgi:hypothetical protein